MIVPAVQAETAAFLRNLADQDPVETHISLVFLGADTVWKLKKSVRLSFLDFTDPHQRHRFLLRELVLNASGAPGLYRDVVAVVHRPDGTLALGEGENAAFSPLDWVLRMARVPATDFLDIMAAEGKLDAILLDQLADEVAAYHARALVAHIDVVASMRAVIEGNLRAANAAGLPERALSEWQARIMPVLHAGADRLRARAASGFVRRGHGDLHLGNLCLWQGRPAAFDALEFDEDLATIDTGYDLGFLLMDLDCRVDRAAANRVMNRYVARTGDAGLTALLPLFLSLRAMVLAHVRLTRGDPAASAGYLKAALDYLKPVAPVALAIGGLQGSGKSTLARALAPNLGPAPGALVLRSDEIRKLRNGVAPENPLPKAAYTEAESMAVFAALAEALGETVSGGHSVIADATFIDPAHRHAVTAAAQEAGVPFLGLWLDAPLSLLESRITARQNDASDATVAVLRVASRAKTIPPHRWPKINAAEFEPALAAASKAVLELQSRSAN